MSTEETSDSKVRICTGDESETLWATSLGDDLYQLDNHPFFAYDVSWKDVVYAPTPEGSNFPEFVRVVRRSGNRTFRIIYDPQVGSKKQADAVDNQLQRLACRYEGATETYLAYNVPPETDFQQVVRILTNQPFQWEYGDPSYDTVQNSPGLQPVPITTPVVKPSLLKRLISKRK